MKYLSNLVKLSYSLLAVVVLLPSMLFAQGLINNGAKIVITNTSSIYVNGTTGHYTNQSGGLITNSTSGGTLYLGGNWVNNASNTGFSNDGATVTLNAAGAQTVGGSNASAFYNLTCLNGNTKTVNTALSVSNYVNVGSSTTLNSNGYMTLLATATTNANVKPLLSGASVTGNVIVQSYFTGGSSSFRGNRLISSPVNETGLSTKTYAQLKQYMIITGPGGAANGFDVGGTASPTGITLTRYNEPAKSTASQFTSVATINDAISAGNGFYVFFRGNRSGYTSGTTTTSLKVNAPFAVPENTTMQYLGPINQGNVTVNLSYTNNPGESTYNGYNMVGNPYPSVINWASVTKNNVQDMVMILKPGGGYATYLNGISTNSGGADLNYIQPGQGFFVKATSSGASLVFTESAKNTAGNTPARFLSSPSEQIAEGKSFKTSGLNRISGAPGLGNVFSVNQLRFNLQDAVNKEETVALFNSANNALAGSEDAAFFGGSTISLSTLSSDSKDLVINFMPDISQVTELKLDVNATATTDVTLNFTDFSAVGNYSVLLKDNYLNTLVDVKTNPVYNFTMNKSTAATFGTERLKLLFQPPTTLPVSLVSFTAKKIAAGAELSWKTASEQNSSHFNIERSADGKVFANLATVKASGNSSSPITYSVVDKNPLKGTSYYRLIQVDNDGKLTTYNPVSIKYDLETDAIAFSIFPNPVTEGFEAKFSDSKNTVDGLILNVYDLGGQKVGSKSFAKGQEIKYNMSTMPNSIYIVEAINAKSNEVVGKGKVIKE